MKLRDHLNKLEYFCVVVEEKSLKNAAQKAYVGQPQLTKIIKQLEDALGVDLFVRTSKGLNVTKAGLTLYNTAKEVLAQVNETEYKIKSHIVAIEGSIRIGTYDSIARYFFPEFLRYLKFTAPNMNVFLETSRSKLILDKLIERKLDAAIIVTSDVPKNIIGKTIYTDSFGLYASPSLSAEETDRLIYFEYPPNNIESSLKTYKFNRTTSCDNLETVKGLTEEAMGVGLLPHRVAKEGVLCKKLVPYKHTKIKNNEFDAHEIKICYSESIKNKATITFLDELERFFQIWSKS